ERTTALKVIDKIFHETDKQDEYTELKVQEILKDIGKIYWDPNKTPHPVFSRGNGSTNSKHLNLLNQNERRDHWMYSSWHHLPPYTTPKGMERYEYPASHYLHLLNRQPKEYVIHPDFK
ncbi:unnamed protein product, partial [Heterobilharzia americana]